MLLPFYNNNVNYCSTKQHYDGDVEDLCLDFTVTEELGGKRIVHELRPGGKSISVTNENKLHYVHAMADFKLNRQVRDLVCFSYDLWGFSYGLWGFALYQQENLFIAPLSLQILPFANAFYRGLSDLISPSWLSLFNANEFNQVILFSFLSFFRGEDSSLYFGCYWTGVPCYTVENDPWTNSSK